MIIGFKNHGLLIRFVIIFFCLNTYSFGEVTNSLARFNLIESFEADFTQKVFDGESTAGLDMRPPTEDTSLPGVKNGEGDATGGGDCIEFPGVVV